jgi:cyclopropane fatty-acyl-phospholipid synthase-like methyltransferase
MKEWYSNYFKRTAESAAHKKFRMQLLGTDRIHTYSSTNLKQIDKIIEVLKPDGNSKLLELGSGDGSIAEYISERTGATIIGIDFSREAIEQSKNKTKGKSDTLLFYEADINNFYIEGNDFEAVYCVDSLYFTPDLSGLIRRRRDLLKNEGKMAFLYCQINQNDDPKEMLEPGRTKLAQALLENDCIFTAIDYVEDVRQCALDSKVIAEKLKDEFEMQGNIELYNDIISNYNEVMHWFDNKLISRYLYSVSNPL